MGTKLQATLSPIYGQVMDLYNRGGFVEIIGGPGSGRSSFVRKCLELHGGRTLVLNDSTDYNGLENTLAMPNANPDFIFPAIRELLLRRVVDSIVIDQIQLLDNGADTILSTVNKYFPTLLLPVFQNKTVVYIVNNDSYVPIDDNGSKVITSPGSKYLNLISDIRIFAPGNGITPVII